MGEEGKKKDKDIAGGERKKCIKEEDVRKQEWEDSEIHRHTGLSMHKKREQLKESTETLQRPDQQAKVNYTTQASCWLGL